MTLLLGALGLVALDNPVLASDIELRLVVPCVSGLTQYPSPFSDKKPICVSGDVIANDANIIRVKPDFDKTAGSRIEVEFDRIAQEKLAETTEANFGRQLAFLSRGQLVTAAMIDAPIRGGVMELYLPDKYREPVLRVFQDRKLVQ